ncbi:hypothetical protein TRAPUB_14359 [Trametes pubescens]|uniref:Uncharacterized protein n=1 Tax=Trametes pubescens TaxID=154538 RepID=A0A1M2VNS8_TRAPU|nr:hypothetical protein TRAPUB_14359 [Trametes pubescens]
MTFPDYSDYADYPPGHPLQRDRVEPPPSRGQSSRDSRDGPWPSSPGPYRDREWDQTPPSFGPQYGSRGGGSGPSGPPMGWNQPPGSGGPTGPPMGWNQPSGFQPYQGGMPYQQSAGPGPDTWMAALHAQSENTQLTRELGDVRLQLQESQFNLDRLQSDYDSLQRELQTVRAERADLQAELQRARGSTSRGRPPSMDRVDEGRRVRRDDHVRRSPSPQPTRRDDRARRSPSPQNDRRPARADRRPRPDERSRRSLSLREDRRATTPVRDSPRPLQLRLSDAPAVPLAERIQPDPPVQAPSLRDRLAPRPASRERALAPPRGRRSPEDVPMVDARTGGAGTATAVRPGPMKSAPDEVKIAPPASSGTPSAPSANPAPPSRRAAGKGAVVPGSSNKKMYLPGPPARPVPELTRVPQTRGLDIEEVDALRHRPDPALDASPQPKSAWYLRWISIQTMADEYAVDDEEYIAGDELAGEADFNEPDCPFPDPIMARRRDMTDVAESKETYRVNSAKTKSTEETSEATLLAEFRRATLDLGDWSGTMIESVVQAHNLRWLATVEFELPAIEYLKAIRQLYGHAGLRRTAGIRYLLRTAETDNFAMRLGRRTDLGESYPAPDNNCFPYPPPTSTPEAVRRYFRNVPTRYWHTLIRRADGSSPSHTAQEYGVPHSDDAYAAFVSKHTQSIPSGRQSEAVRKLPVVLRNGLIALFGLPGLYRHICELGGYFVHPRRSPAPYPFESAGVIHVAAWLAEFGIGDSEGCILFFERWSKTYVAKNGPRQVATFASIDEFSASDQSHLVVGREQLEWGPRAFDSPDSPSSRAFFPDADGDSAPSVGQPRSAASRSRSPLRSQSAVVAPARSPARSRRARRATLEEDEISIYSTDEEFGMHGVTFHAPGSRTDEPDK